MSSESYSVWFLTFMPLFGFKYSLFLPAVRKCLFLDDSFNELSEFTIYYINYGQSIKKQQQKMCAMSDDSSSLSTPFKV